MQVGLFDTSQVQVGASLLRQVTVGSLSGKTSIDVADAVTAIATVDAAADVEADVAVPVSAIGALAAAAAVD